MLAAITAIGAWNWDASFAGDAGESAVAVLTALIFHLIVLVAFKLGAFLVLSILESDGDASRLSSLGGLAKREPFLAVAMFIFMISLAGVPPLADTESLTSDCRVVKTEGSRSQPLGHAS